tara:strand:+ start:554 stop:1699 length:1146 start_codon:yes stop_codon:yes gene_type:complete
MADATEKLDFEDISFDDMIGEGLQTAEVSEEKVAEKPVETKAPVDEKPAEEPISEPTSNELDSDAVTKEEGPVKDEIVDEIPETKTEVKEETPIDQDNVEDITVVQEVLEKLGYKPQKNYSDTSEGLVQMTKDVGAQMANEHMQQLMNEFPLVKQHLEYVMSGGQSQEFMTKFDPRQDYEKIKIDEKDTAIQKMLVGNYFKMKGHDEAFIKDLLEDYEDAGKLQGKAELAQKALINAQKHQRDEMLKVQKEKAQKDLQERKKFWDDVYDTVQSSNEFHGIMVPEKEKKKFFRYISAPINKDGMTQRDVDHVKSDIKTKLAIDYLMYKGFKLNDIIKNKVATTKAKDLRSRITKHQDKIKSAKRAPRRNTGFDIEDLDLTVI